MGAVGGPKDGSISMTSGEILTPVIGVDAGDLRVRVRGRAGCSDVMLSIRRSDEAGFALTKCLAGGILIRPLKETIQLKRYCIYEEGLKGTHWYVIPCAQLF